MTQSSVDWAISYWHIHKKVAINIAIKQLHSAIAELTCYSSAITTDYAGSPEGLPRKEQFGIANAEFF